MTIKFDQQRGTKSVAELQAQMVAQSLADSKLDRRIPLALPSVPQPLDGGMSCADYFKRKHDAGNRGRFFPLHEFKLGLIDFRVSI